jgi:hypothetical protein
MKILEKEKSEVITVEHPNENLDLTLDRLDDIRKRGG